MTTNKPYSRRSMSAQGRRRLNQRLDQLARAQSRALIAELRAIRAEREVYQNAIYIAFFAFFGVVGCIVSFILILYFF